MDEVDEKTLAWWLAERQLPNGGLNGRPEKLEDVNSASLDQIVFLVLMPSETGLLFVLGPLISGNLEKTTLDQ